MSVNNIASQNDVIGTEDKKSGIMVDFERKKASHIMHYLMERRQECEYSDPFELLKNMNDVNLAYEPMEKRVKDKQNED